MVWVFPIATGAAALSCPAMLWLGRRGIGPGYILCQSRDKGPLNDLHDQQRAPTLQTETIESRPTLCVA